MSKSFFEKYEVLKQEKEITDIVAFNKKTATFGLSLTVEEARRLVVYKNETLKRQRRVELGESILSRIIYTFCDSQFITQENYLETMESLQELFFMFKNESLDLVTDDELLEFMREQFENICFGSIEYLGTTCLVRFSSAIRAGYKGGTDKLKETVNPETRWDRDLYLSALYDSLS